MKRLAEGAGSTENAIDAKRVRRRSATRRRMRTGGSLSLLLTFVSASRIYVRVRSFHQKESIRSGAASAGVVDDDVLGKLFR